jgi:peptidoglycan/LPS O-acetylase OafA/YrhL
VVQARLAGLDGLRVFAAFCVLFAHGGYFLFAAWPHFDAYVFAGWLGTEVFFALAGFLLIAQLLAQPPRSARGIREWWTWRAWRILPLFWLALALHVVLAQFAQNAPGIEAAGFVVLAQNLAWTHPAFFGEAWNLPLLMGFSLVLPWMAYVAARSHRMASRLALLLAVALLLGLVVRGLWVDALNLSWDEGVRKVVLARLDSCIYGALAACLVSMWPGLSTQRRVLGVLAGGVLLLALAGFFLLARDTSVVARIALFTLSGIGFALACLAWSTTTGAPPSSATRWLAQRSYALYLCNMPVLLGMMQLGFVQTPQAGRGLLLFVVWLFLSCGVAEAVHRWLERPLLASRARSVSAAASATSR